MPRPENATLPPNGVETLAGLYEDPAYGRMELCLASANSSAFTSSDSCRALLSNITTVLPGVVDPTIPTLLVKWDRPFGTYIRLTHLNESTFSLSIFDSYVSVATLHAAVSLTTPFFVAHRKLFKPVLGVPRSCVGTAG